MKRISSIHGINPRFDKDVVMTIVLRFLDSCDPDDRPDITMTVDDDKTVGP